MDHFESLVATLLEREGESEGEQGYWVRRSFKVRLEPEEKAKIERPTMPRVEIDLLAFDFDKNKVIAFEVKSFLDSPGVRLTELQELSDVPKGRYKLFTSSLYRESFRQQLKLSLIKKKMANQKTQVTFGLAAGKVYQGKSKEIRALMEKNGWLFWSPEDIREKVEKLADTGYENDAIIITAKVLLRLGNRK